MRATSSRRPLIDIMFFGGVPVVLAVLTALLGPYASKIGPLAAIAYVVALSLVPWWLAGLATHAVGRIAGGRLPLWLAAGVGAVLAGPLVILYALAVNAAAAAIWPAFATFVHPPLGAEHWKAIAMSEGRAIVLWIAFVLIFRETLGWGRFTPDLPPARSEQRFQLSGAAWTGEDDTVLRNFIGEGMAPRAIASEMKRTVGAVRARTAKLGLRNNPKRGSAVD